MRHAAGTTPANLDRHVQADRLLPTLRRTSRHRFHDDDDRSSEDSRHSERDDPSDPNVEDES
jgi:hypothetical protein